MKNLAILFLSLTSLTAVAKDNPKKNRIPKNKYAISLSVGRAVNLDDITLQDVLDYSVYHTTINLYRNFNRLQIGAGVDIELVDHKNGIRKSFITPYLLANRTLEANNICFYTGVMLGYANYGYTYTVDNHSYKVNDKTTGNGIVGGIQLGMIFKISKFIAINSEIAPRARWVKYNNTHIETGNVYGSTNGLVSTKSTSYNASDFYMPVQVGIRVRF